MSLLGSPEWHGRIFTGTWVTGRGGEAESREPATGDVLARHGVATPDDLASSAAAAAEAQRAWAATRHTERAAVLRRAGDLFTEHAAEIGDWIVRESGSIRLKAGFETHIAAQESYEASALPSRAYGSLLPSEQPRLSLSRRVPAGVVGVISPFNAPLILAIRSVAPALALGNAVLLKPDPRTAVCGGVVLARVFEEAGLPAGLLHVLPGGPETGEALLTDPRVSVVSFTGSTAVGRRVAEVAGRHLKRVHLELGGNSALVVLDDADLERAIGVGAWGTFFHQGQICMTAGRHLVHASVYDEYVARLGEHADRLVVGDPTGDVALGPIIDERQRDRVHAIVTGSVAAGAKLTAGGSYSGLFYRPTVLAEVTPAVEAFRQEIFGPVAPVTRFSSLDEAAALAADCEYGLSFAVVTRDVMKGLAFAGRVPTGVVHINDQTFDDEANVPIGGVRDSGTGVRFGGPENNIEAFTETQWVTVQAAPPQYPF